MANDQERQEQRQTPQKRIALKEDGYYANCAMVELYDHSVYLPHLQATVLYDALGRSLGSLSGLPRQLQTGEPNAERVMQKVGENS